MSHLDDFIRVTSVDFHTLALYGYLRELELNNDPMSDSFPKKATHVQMDALAKMDLETRTVYAARYLCWMALKTLSPNPMLNSQIIYNMLVGTLIVKLGGVITIEGAQDMIEDADAAIEDILVVRDQAQKIIDMYNKKTK